MEDATARGATPETVWSRAVRSNALPTALGYLLWLVLAELALVVAFLTADMFWYYVAIFLDLALIVAGLVHATRVYLRNPAVAAFLTALVLAPLVRVASLSAPLSPFSILEFLFLIAFPLLFSTVGVAVALNLKPKDLYLRLGSLKNVAANVGIGASGLGLGLVEFQILRPSPWIPELTATAFVVGTLIVFLSTGLAEELIFRGAMLRTAERTFGSTPGLLLVTVVFTVLHIGFLSPVDLGFVFLAGLYFGVVVQKTGSLYGAIAAHTLANVMLYLVLPFAPGVG